MPSRLRAIVPLVLLLAVCGGVTVKAEEKYQVAELKEAPTGLADSVKGAINATGYRITGSAGPICDVWLATDVKLKPNFKSTPRIRYPFLNGTLIGAIRFPEKGEYTDFRGQAIKPGLYTLRSGLQPDDGNHLGTSEIRDFLVACPPDKDTDPKRIDKIKSLFKLSAGAAGTTHPAIYLLQAPPEKPFSAPNVKFDAQHKLVVLEVNLSGKDGEKSVTIPLNLVTVGKTQG